MSDGTPGDEVENQDKQVYGKSLFNDFLSKIDEKISGVKNGEMMTARALFLEIQDHRRAMAADDVRNLLGRALHVLNKCR